MEHSDLKTAYYHLPGLFEFYEFYQAFLALYSWHREYFYDWCEIGSIYGSPADCRWGGGRIENGFASADEVISLMRDYGVSPRLTLSNSMLVEADLADESCNRLCQTFAEEKSLDTGIIITSDLLLAYLREKYPEFYFVSSTTKVLRDFQDFTEELKRPEFKYVVPDFRLNKDFSHLSALTQAKKDQVEFLCNECCFPGCYDRKNCYDTVSLQNLGQDCPDHICVSPEAEEGYKFSKAMENPCFISLEDIQNVYMPMGFSNFKIEGRSLGSALLLEFILYYMTKPECQLKVREELYLDSQLDLF